MDNSWISEFIIEGDWKRVDFYNSNWVRDNQPLFTIGFCEEDDYFYARIFCEKEEDFQKLKIVLKKDRKFASGKLEESKLDYTTSLWWKWLPESSSGWLDKPNEMNLGYNFSDVENKFFKRLFNEDFFKKGINAAIVKEYVTTMIELKEITVKYIEEILG